MKKVRLPDKKKLILFLIPIVAIVIALIFLAPSFQQKPKENVTVIIPEPFIYHSPDKNFALTYMDDWSTFVSPGPPMFSILLSPPGLPPGTVRIDERYLNENRTLDQYYENLIADYHVNFNVTDIKTSDTTISGFPAKQIEFTWVDDGVLRKKMETIIVADNLSFSMNYKNRVELYDANLPAVENVFQSMNIARIFTTPTALITTEPTLTAPILYSLSPSSILAGSTNLNLALTGAEFVNEAKVIWNGIPLITTFISTRQLVAVVPDSFLVDSGTSNVFITNGNNANSNILKFSILKPFERVNWDSFKRGDVLKFTKATLSPYSYVLVTSEDVGRQYQVQRLYKVNNNTLIRDKSSNGVFITSYDTLQNRAVKVGVVPYEMLKLDTFTFQNPI